MNNYNHANVSKLIKDFKSQVECLPGPVKNNDVKETGKLMSEKRKEKSDIFFSRKSDTALPTEKTRKFVFTRKNKQSNEVEISKRKSARPEHIKNVFESQIFK